VINKPNIGYGVGAILIAQNLVYSSTIGPVCYTIVAEMPSTRLRAKTVVLARLAYNLMGLPVNVLAQRQINPAAWNWGAKAGFFWMGSCILCSIYLVSCALFAGHGRSKLLI
jgi:SP family general alpha glucoside:H+ symporter-like MFS transporter